GVAWAAGSAGNRPGPSGTGPHPSRTAGAATVDECELTLPVARWLPADSRGIPSGPAQGVAGTPFDFRAARPVGTVRLDHAFTGLERNEAGLARAPLARGGTGAAPRAGAGYRWLQDFAGGAARSEASRRAGAIV